MPPTVAFAPVQPTDGDGRGGAALSHIGEATQPRSCPVILNQAADLPNFPVGNRGSGYGTLRQQGGTRERRGARPGCRGGSPAGSAGCGGGDRRRAGKSGPVVGCRVW